MTYHSHAKGDGPRVESGGDAALPQGPAGCVDRGGGGGRGEGGWGWRGRRGELRATGG